MITNACLRYLLFELQSYHCSLTDLIPSARDCVMITSEFLQELLRSSK